MTIYSDSPNEYNTPRMYARTVKLQGFKEERSRTASAERRAGSREGRNTNQDRTTIQPKPPFGGLWYRGRYIHANMTSAFWRVYHKARNISTIRESEATSNSSSCVVMPNCGILSPLILWYLSRKKGFQLCLQNMEGAVCLTHSQSNKAGNGSQLKQASARHASGLRRYT